MCVTYNLAVESLPKFVIFLQIILIHDTAIDISVIKMVYSVINPAYSVIKAV